MTWAGKVVPGPRKPDSSDTLQSRSGLEDLALHLRRHANGLEGRSVVRHMDRPAARLDGSTDRLIHALLPARHLLPGPCPVDTHHESVHVFLLKFNVSRRGENPKKNNHRNCQINRGLSNDAAAPKSAATIDGRHRAS